MSGGPRASGSGVLVPFPAGQNPPKPLGAFDGTKTIIVTMPGNIKTGQVRNLSVWCRAFGVNFGDIAIPRQQRPAAAKDE